MARFLFAPISFTGHVNPGLPIAQELVRRGHDVRWYSIPRFKNAIEAIGARYVPMTRGTPYEESRLEEQLPERAALKGIKQLNYDLNKVFIETIPGVMQDLEEAMRQEPADVLVGDNGSGAPGLLHERMGIPWAAYGITALVLTSIDSPPFGLGMLPSPGPAGRVRNQALNWAVENIIFRDPCENFQRVRRTVGLGRSQHNLFDYARTADVYLQATIPSFEYPRTDMPENVRFIGGFVPEPPAAWTPPAWWDQLDGSKPVVLVTQGTIANDYDELIRPAIRALADQDIQVIVTTGSKPPEAVEIDPLPANVRVEQFIPYAHLMPKVDLFLTNGGYGSIQIAMHFGVPVVAFGASEDKADIACRVQWSGLGLGVKTKTPSVSQIQTAVREALAEPRFRIRPATLQKEMSQYEPRRLAVEALEALAPAQRREPFVVA